MLKILKEFDPWAAEVRLVDQSERVDSTQDPWRGLTPDLLCDVRGGRVNEEMKDVTAFRRGWVKRGYGLSR